MGRLGSTSTCPKLSNVGDAAQWVTYTPEGAFPTVCNAERYAAMIAQQVPLPHSTLDACMQAVCVISHAPVPSSHGQRGLQQPIHANCMHTPSAPPPGVPWRHQSQCACQNLVVLAGRPGGAGAVARVGARNGAAAARRRALPRRRPALRPGCAALSYPRSCIPTSCRTAPSHKTVLQMQSRGQGGRDF